ncbi:MAG: putative transporter [Nevskia sp.]|nr:putative transporter [Nevskia sp.]
MMPLAITSVLCETLMVGLGIGLKAATLPVVALVGVTLAASVVTWAWLPIKFQASMGRC